MYHAYYSIIANTELKTFSPSSGRSRRGSDIRNFANFGNKHFEEWSAKSLDKGIGGSETAVIELSKQWIKMGYKVTVYGDPGGDKGEIDGVIYLPWYYFNHRDSFNIFIAWRTPGLVGKIKAKKFYIDMHDIFSPVDFKEHVNQIDGIMVKSEYHKKLAYMEPGNVIDRCIVIPNGI